MQEEIGRSDADAHSPTQSGASVPTEMAPFVGDADGYPDEEWLAALSAHDFSPDEAKWFLLDGFKDACEGIACCSYSAEPEVDFAYGPGMRVRFSTGGWSGAEDLIDAMLQHFWINHHHSQWRRGGHYEFFVPNPARPEQTERPDLG